MVVQAARYGQRRIYSATPNWWRFLNMSSNRKETANIIQFRQGVLLAETQNNKWLVQLDTPGRWAGERGGNAAGHGE